MPATDRRRASAPTTRTALTLDQLVAAAAREHASAEAFVDATQRLTYGELDAAVSEHACALLAHGVLPGDKVALWMANRVEWVVLLLATARVGAVLVPVNTGFTVEEAAYVVGRSDAVLLLVGPGPRGRDLAADARFVLEDDRVSARSCVVVGEGAEPAGTLRLADLLARADQVPAERLREVADAVAPDDVVVILFTSGTTGFPKGVMQPQRLVVNMRDAADRLRLAPGDTTVMYLPLFHIFALAAVVSFVTAGSRMVLMETFSGGASLELMERERATVAYGVATHYHDQLRDPSYDERDLSALRLCISPGTADLVREVSERMAPAVNCYGMTETTSMTTLGDVEDPLDERAETVGRPLPASEVRVVDERGRDLPVGVVGEVLVRGPAVLVGYYGDEAATARAMRDGWFHTGDGAALTPTGALRFAGRRTEMFKVGGENVDPFEVEAVLMRHPRVGVASVVGVPDDRLGEVGLAHLTSRDGAPLDLDGVRAFARERLASFKVPRHFVQQEDLPTTASGKVQKFKLRDEYLSTQHDPNRESR